MHLVANHADNEIDRDRNAKNHIEIIKQLERMLKFMIAIV